MSEKKSVEECEEEREGLKVVLTDIKITARDVDDFNESRKLKKEIKKFQEEIDEYCAEKDE
jgi:phage host-nuclease inhibitor protein Gam